MLPREVKGTTLMLDCHSVQSNATVQTGMSSGCMAAVMITEHRYLRGSVSSSCSSCYIIHYNLEYPAARSLYAGQCHSSRGGACHGTLDTEYAYLLFNLHCSVEIC